MPDKVINKVIYGGNTLIDLTADTITAADVLNNKVFHLPSGVIATGTSTYDSDTSDDTAVVAEVLASKTFHARGSALTGTMPNRGAVAGVIDTVDGVYTIQNGYHDGSGTVAISATERAKIIASNIREGIVILGVTGTMSGEEGVNAESVNVTPMTTAQTITPSSGYNYISQVVVAAIPYTETENAAGGKTVTIASA